LNYPVVRGGGVKVALTLHFSNISQIMPPSRKKLKTKKEAHQSTLSHDTIFLVLEYLDHKNLSKARRISKKWNRVYIRHEPLLWKNLLYRTFRISAIDAKQVYITNLNYKNLKYNFIQTDQDLGYPVESVQSMSSAEDLNYPVVQSLSSAEDLIVQSISTAEYLVEPVRLIPNIEDLVEPIESSQTIPTIQELSFPVQTSINADQVVFTWPINVGDAYLVVFDGNKVCWLDQSVHSTTEILVATITNNPQKLIEPEFTLTGHLMPVGLLLGNGMGDLVSFDESSMVYIWDLEKRQKTGEIDTSEQLSSIISMNVCKNRMVTGGSNGKIVVWNINSFEIVYSLDEVFDLPLNVGIFEDLLVYGLANGMYGVHDMEKNELKFEFNTLEEEDDDEEEQPQQSIVLQSVAVPEAAEEGLLPNHAANIESEVAEPDSEHTEVEPEEEQHQLDTIIQLVQSWPSELQQQVLNEIRQLVVQGIEQVELRQESLQVLPESNFKTELVVLLETGLQLCHQLLELVDSEDFQSGVVLTVQDSFIHNQQSINVLLQELVQAQQVILQQQNSALHQQLLEENQLLHQQSQLQQQIHESLQNQHHNLLQQIQHLQGQYQEQIVLQEQVILDNDFEPEFEELFIVPRTLALNNHILVTNGPDNKSFTLWNLISGKKMKIFRQENVVRLVELSRDSSVIYSCGEDTLSAWDFQGERSLSCFKTLLGQEDGSLPVWVCTKSE
jgi:WD40 repeat protein